MLNRRLRLLLRRQPGHPHFIGDNLHRHRPGSASCTPGWRRVATWIVALLQFIVGQTNALAAKDQRHRRMLTLRRRFSDRIRAGRASATAACGSARWCQPPGYSLPALHQGVSTICALPITSLAPAARAIACESGLTSGLTSHRLVKSPWFHRAGYGAPCCRYGRFLPVRFEYFAGIMVLRLKIIRACYHKTET
ncbi:Uncharacterised protein [Klebsiella pneumoniae]|uniref:Uncharacterized protein n=1 Tax=Klebsiella pneumoniae TaxID=573 RepID=A0A3S4GCQ5_KLEPN|nr:Uncharacterised protein [Klebsiella pneumoniae]